ncbi:hypothetical protein O1611_g5 [Lasiodiplodia mahajangana]|uniref:Uncharacterized protein n=1 Tax=Lasiodiplodia mahajangana TaxID=1108764 RepID=A0ACC2K1P7_9PEZI|nr:hypothetical protein O1611_g5 [Lasiodiplodia mahajangana]
MIKREDLSDRRDNSLQGPRPLVNGLPTIPFYSQPGPPASRWGSSLLGVSSNIPVSDGLPKNTKAERSERGLADYESARPLHTQPSLYEGDPFMSPSPTIQADTPSSSRIKGKPDLHHDRPSPGSTSRGSTSRNKEGGPLPSEGPGPPLADPE